MKRSPIHIVFSLFLAAALLFSQVGLGYFHDKHDAHEQIEKAHKDQTQLHKHGEHCKVCSIDLFTNLYADDGFIPLERSIVYETPGTLPDNFRSLSLSFCKGRAPPTFNI